MNAVSKVAAPLNEMVRYDAMCRAIEAAYEVDEVKNIRDKALALERYAAQANNVEAERQACEIRLRAEKRSGVLIRAMEKAKGGEQYHKSTPNMVSGVVAEPQQTLADLGISHKQSSDWQKLADVPEEDFEAALKGPTKPTTSGIIAAHAPTRPEKPRDKVDARALWLWGRLQDFEREGLLDAEPEELIATMLEHMKVTTLEMAPRVALWLGRIKS